MKRITAVSYTHLGNVVAAGTPEEVMANENSLTGQYLSGKRKIEIPAKRRKGNGKKLEIVGASENNLKNVSVKIPLGTLTVVTGVSGSGKSSLVNEVLKMCIRDSALADIGRRLIMEPDTLKKAWQEFNSTMKES